MESGTQPALVVGALRLEDLDLFLQAAALGLQAVEDALAFAPGDGLEVLGLGAGGSSYVAGLHGGFGLDLVRSALR
ncbi:hypothetical protein [Streptomyces tanashiensis]|uniref:hypothetical protein n=1 Tax=Streptomyces tanashiensis TaxID=67367 RepID=UPI0034424FEA